MAETIKALWLTDENQVKIAPKTLSSQIINEDGTSFEESTKAYIDNAVANGGTAQSAVKIVRWE